MKRIISIAFTLILLAAGAFAQMAPPTPAPELKKLDYFVGNWATEATVAPGPWGGGGKFTDTDHVEWRKGSFYLLSHSDFSLPPEVGGEGSSLSVLGYDTDKKVYTEERFDSTGRHVVMTGTLNGDTLTWTGENNTTECRLLHALLSKWFRPLLTR